MSDSLNIALVQSHLLWENPEANRQLLSDKMENIPEEVDLIVLPEMFTTGFTMEPEKIDRAEAVKTLDWMKKLAAKKGAALCGSVIYSESNRFYNRLFFVDDRGDFSHYDKKHTFTLAGEDKVYEAGNSKLVLQYKGFKICPLICYDLRFPVWARNTEDYDVLLYVANWPKPRIAAWDALLKARAIENMAYCIGVNRIGLDGLGHQYSGHSAAYDVLGNTVAFSEKEEIVYTTLSKDHIVQNRGKLRFLEDRDDFSLL